MSPVSEPLPERLGGINLVACTEPGRSEGNGGSRPMILDVPCPLRLRPLPC